MAICAESDTGIFAKSKKFNSEEKWRRHAQIYMLKSSGNISIYDYLFYEFINRIVEKQGIAPLSQIPPVDFARLAAARNLFIFAERQCRNRKQLRSTFLRTIQLLLIMLISMLSFILVYSTVHYIKTLFSTL